MQQINQIDPKNILEDSSKNFNSDNQLDELEKSVINLLAASSLENDALICSTIETMESKHYQQPLNEIKNKKFLFCMERLQKSFQGRADLSKSSHKIREIVHNFWVPLC